MRLLRAFLRDESGSNVVEYALLASLISVAAVTAMSVMGVQVTVFYTDTFTAMGR